MSRSSSLTVSRLLPAVVGSALLLSACGGGSSGGSSGSGTTPSASSSLAALLPDAVRKAGVLKVGSDISYAPVEFLGPDGTTPTGIDPDLAKAIGDELGVKLQFANGTFDGLIPQLTQSKRIDLIMSAMSDTPKRQASVDFVDYFDAGTSILVKKGNPGKVASLDDLCGKTIGLERGTTQDDLATAQVKTCASAGKGTLKVLRFDTDTEALTALKSGRSDADMNDFPVAAYNAQKSGGGNDFEVVGEQLGAGPYGIAVRKTDTQLRDALQKAVQALIDDGTYAKILAKWDVAKGAVTQATVNAGK